MEQFKTNYEAFFNRIFGNPTMITLAKCWWLILLFTITSGILILRKVELYREQGQNIKADILMIVGSV